MRSKRLRLFVTDMMHTANSVAAALWGCSVGTGSREKRALTHGLRFAFQVLNQIARVAIPP